jgi:signal peptide peptidase SppA
MISYNEIRNAVFSALEADGIQGIVLNMDTPGGSASGVDELSEFLAEVDSKVMPIYTYAGTTMASGGYWLGSVGREIYASKLATIGSIGVITVHVSYAKMYKDAGMEITVLRAGEFKALGSPYEKLDDKARAQLEAQMNSIYDVFLETVADNRGTSVIALKETAAEGRIFIGAEAVTVGLVDNITSYDAAIADISQKVRSSSTRSPFNPPSSIIVGDIDMKKKVLTEAGVAAIESGVPEAEVFADPKMVVEMTDEEIAAQVAAAEAGEGAAGDNAGSEGEGGEAAGDEGAGNQAAAPQEGSVDMVNNLLDRIATLTTANAALETKVSAAEQESVTSKANETSLTKIAVQAIHKMQVSLGGSPTPLSDASTSAVLEQYNRTYSQFNQKFKVGAQAAVPENEDFDGASNDENASMAAAVTRLTTSKVK